MVKALYSLPETSELITAEQKESGLFPKNGGKNRKDN